MVIKMIDASKPISPDQYDGYMRIRQQLGAPNLETYWISFLYETDQKIQEQSALIKAAEDELQNAEIKARVSSAFEMPNGMLPRILFVVGTLLGITLIGNLVRKIETGVAYSYEKRSIEQRIAQHRNSISEFQAFRKNQLRDLNTFSRWNVGFRELSETPNQTAAVTLAWFMETPRMVMKLNPDLAARFRKLS